MTWGVVVPNPAGIGAVLRSEEVRRMVDGAAEAIAAGARSRGGEDVVVEPYVTDRGAAAVIVRDPRAVGLEAKRGVLTGPARAIGAEVRVR